jgi:hypothetical protein
VGPTFYGNKVASKVTSITEATTTYLPTPTSQLEVSDEWMYTIFPNPASELIAVQYKGMNKGTKVIQLIDGSGRVVKTCQIVAGATIAYFDVSTLYSGEYFIAICEGQQVNTQKINVIH